MSEWIVKAYNKTHVTVYHYTHHTKNPLMRLIATVKVYQSTNYTIHGRGMAISKG